ncbi:MAG: SOS response-associated peptidase [Candidatus Krumholzibacteriia bacterium]
MCGRVTLIAEPTGLAEALGFDAPSDAPADAPAPGWLADLLPRFNVSPSQPLVAARRDPVDGDPALAALRWGLVPAWSRTAAGGPKMINARAETVGIRPAFRDAFARRRCLIPVSGFYEWRRTGGRKQPFYFHASDGRLLALAGIWESWSPPGDAGGDAAGDVAADATPAATDAAADPATDAAMAATAAAANRPAPVPLETCAILTTAANELMAPIHDRMPVILPPDAYRTWLDVPLGDGRPNRSATSRARLQELLRPCPSGWLACHPVHPRVNRGTVDDPACIEPWSEEQALFE